jgi:hypothetical protein
VYAFGIVLWELLTWQLPWVDGNAFQIMRSIAAGGRPPIPAPADLPDSGGVFPGLEGYIQLMQQCWTQEPAERPSFSDALNDLK